MVTRTRSAALLLLALLGGAGSAGLAASVGPGPGVAGVPAGGGFAAEMTCAECHTGGPREPDPSGRLELLGVPTRYAPGARYGLELRISHPGAGLSRWGFQLTAVAAGSLRGAGEFIVTDPVNTQVLAGGETGREYVEHTYQGTAAGRPGGTSWRFDWLAPARDLGDVAFYGGGNAANLDGSKEGDRVFNPTPRPLAIARGPDSAPASEPPQERP
jgi:hypothetical protein